MIETDGEGEILLEIKPDTWMSKQRQDSHVRLLRRSSADPTGKPKPSPLPPHHPPPPPPPRAPVPMFARLTSPPPRLMSPSPRPSKQTRRSSADEALRNIQRRSFSADEMRKRIVRKRIGQAADTARESLERHKQAERERLREFGRELREKVDRRERERLAAQELPPSSIDGDRGNFPPPQYTEAQIRYSEAHGGGLGSARTGSSMQSSDDEWPEWGTPPPPGLQASEATPGEVHRAPPEVLQAEGQAAAKALHAEWPSSPMPLAKFPHATGQVPPCHWPSSPMPLSCS